MVGFEREHSLTQSNIKEKWKVRRGTKLLQMEPELSFQEKRHGGLQEGFLDWWETLD